MASAKTKGAAGHPVTPDGRYFVVRGRLWRMSDPSLSAERRQGLVDELMRARREIASAKRRNDPAALAISHEEVDRLKHALGERGRVWWDDGAEDVNRRMARNTTYAAWFAALGGEGG